MNVGIVTIHNHFNYGAALQAFALNKIVRQLGHQCRTIDCNIEPGFPRKYSRSKHPGELFKNIYLICHREESRRYCERFCSFTRRHLPLTDEKYHSLEQLMTSPPQYDAYITGSDQVWHPFLLERSIGHAFHLSFVTPSQHRLIAYAPSFGVSEIPECYTKRLRDYLLRYHALSVRETRGREIIYRLISREAEVVADPTMLLSSKDYSEITVPSPFSENYLLVYPMELGPDFLFFNVVKKLRKYLSIPTVFIFPLNFSYRWLSLADKAILDAGPSEFLGLFKNAKFICTNSFHGTVFSLLFKKNFLGVTHSKTNSRVYSLLETVGLQGRQVAKPDLEEIQNVVTETIDYTEVTRCINENVVHSLSYLKRALDA